MTKQLRINGQIIHGATEFAYDGCHKIYLIFSPEDRAKMVELGYKLGYDEDGSGILPVSDLPQVWNETCWLRFISRADLTGPNLVEQGEEAQVTWS